MPNELPTPGRLLKSLFSAGGAVPLRRLWTFSIAGALLALLLLQEVVNRLALALDELLFPSFRDVRIQRPLFIVGPPRSGTTLLHRLVADDTQQFTTFPLWELLLAPAICQKLLWLGLHRADAWLGGPLAKSLLWLERLAAGGSRIHHTSLLLPEEDYLALLPQRACFLLVVAFPRCEALWRLARFDEAIPKATRQRILHAYRALLQRHLYVRGRDRRLVSKNPCFTSWIETLAAEFPDARFVGLCRNPQETVPSQLSAIARGVRFFGHHPQDPQLVQRFVETFGFYYRHLARCQSLRPQSQFRLVDFPDLKDNADEVVVATLEQLGYEVQAEFRNRLTSTGRAAREYRSGHAYTPSQFGLSQREIREQCDEAYQQLLASCRRPLCQPPGAVPMKSDPLPRNVEPVLRLRPTAAFDELRVTVVSDAEEGRNGVGTYYQDLAAHLQGRVASIQVIAPARRPSPGHAWFSLPLPGDATQRLFFPRPRMLAQMVEQQRPHVVVLPTLGPYAAAGARLASRCGAALCVAHHTNFDSLVAHYWTRSLAVPCRFALSSAANWLIRRADLVVAMNAESLADARTRKARRVRLAGTPLAAPFLLEPRRPLGETLSRVIFVGRLAAEKGIGHILEAAERLRHFHFVIAGDGPLRSRVESAVRHLPNLDYPGWLGRGDVLAAMDSADVLVLPSAIETFGTVALEALARGRLVLVSAECGIAKWPTLADSLFTIQPGEHLADALTRLANLPAAQRQATVDRGWHTVVQFNNQTVQGWVEILAEAAGGAVRGEGDRQQLELRAG